MGEILKFEKKVKRIEINWHHPGFRHYLKGAKITRKPGANSPLEYNHVSDGMMVTKVGNTMVLSFGINVAGGGRTDIQLEFPEEEFKHLLDIMHTIRPKQL